MWSVIFQNLKGHDCWITIKNGNEQTSTATGLTPSARPFEIEIDDSDDVFTPVRTSSGNIGIIINRVLKDGSVLDSSNTIREIINAIPRDRAVKFRCDDKVVWQGFVKAESYEHNLFAVSEELSIPVISSLKALESINVSIEIGSNHYWKPFGQILIEMTDLIGAPFKYFAIPKRMMSTSALPNNPFIGNLNLLNYIEMRSPESYETDAQGHTIYYDGKPYLDVLSDVCRFLGLSAVENGETLIFQQLDVRNAQYNFYTRQQVLDGGRTSTKTEILDEKNIANFFTFANTDHSFSVVSGRSSIEVVGKANSLNAIFSLDSIRDMSTILGDGSSFEDVKGNQVAEYRLSDTPLLEYSNNDNPTAKNGVLERCRWDQNIRGSFFELMGEISDMKKSGTYIYSYSGSVNPCVLLVGNPASVVLKPLVVASFTAPAIIVKMRLKVKNSPTGEWTNPSPLAYSATSVNIHINGSLQEIIEADGEIILVLFNYKGEPITISKNANRTERFLKIEQLEIKYDTKSIDKFGAENSYNSDVVDKRTIGNGFVDEYKAEIGIKSKGFGVSVYICDASHEASLADRICKYYKQSKSRITISVDSESFIDPRRTFLHNNVLYNIVGQKMMANDNVIKLTLQETLRS